MGLFFGRKKKQNDADPPKEKLSEFDRDVKELLNRDDIESRTDLCKAEYLKGLSLAEKPMTEERLHRAYDIMGNLASQFDYVPAILWMGDFAENIAQNLEQAAFWYKKAADLGSGNGSRCYADMLMTGRGVARDVRQAIQYYADAADKGVPEAAFVLGEMFRKSGDRDNAVKMYQKALQGGYKPAGIRLQQMGVK